MKQKIVIKVSVDSDKTRSKALKIAAVAQGVSSVALEGGDKDELVVIGDEVDSVCLAKLLRKKFNHARILKVEEVKKEKKEEKKIFYYYPPYPLRAEEVKEEKKEEEKEEEVKEIFYYNPPCPPSYEVYDPYPNNICTIM